MIGQIIDVYRVTRKLGQGGMGSVYQAVDTQLNRTVALKVMNVENDDMFIKRFRAEAQALARLDHRNIVRIFGLRETKMGLVIIMEYVEGKDWSEYAAEGKFKSPRDTINITNQLLDALAYAHKRGIIHRDIKPSNIMIMDDGTVKVTDFGLAKLIDPQSTMAQSPLTQVGQAVGSLFYMSPEQVRGLNTVDHRTDLYSSGITMYEVLAGRPPFDDQTMTTPYVIQKKIVDGELEGLNTSGRDIPKILAGIVSKATHVKPDKRFQSADEMKQALDACLASLGGASPKKTVRVPKTGKPAWLMPAGIIGLVLIIAVVAIGYALWGPLSEGGERSISFTVEPATARVFVDSKIIDNPQEFEIAEGSYSLQIMAAGFESLETTVTISDDASQRFTYQLRPAPTDGDSLLASNTPTNENDNSTLDEPTRQNPTTSSTQSNNNVITPPVRDNTGSQTTTETQTVAAVGTISVSAVGNGTATVAGKSGSVEVPAGSSQVVSCSANGQQTTKSVSVSAGQSMSVTCYFEGRITVSAVDAATNRAMLAAFSLNGAPQGRKNPFSSTVPVGSHSVTAFLDGYQSGSTTVLLKPGVDSRPTASGRISLSSN